MKVSPFSSIDSLLGENSVRRLSECRVAVAGIGGVGSWAAEALARSGVGAIDLIDLDDICVSNINRQLHATHSTIGRHKVDVMAERILDIHPECQVNTIPKFVTPSNVDEIVNDGLDAIIDATDRTSVKAAILDTARKKNILCIIIGSSGGRKDPTQLCVADFGASGGDNLLRLVRRKLRREYQWEGGEGCRYGIPAIFSTEKVVDPKPEACEASAESARSVRIDCNGVLGAASFITAPFGFVAASTCIQKLLELKKT